MTTPPVTPAATTTDPAAGTAIGRAWAEVLRHMSRRPDTVDLAGAGRLARIMRATWVLRTDAAGRQHCARVTVAYVGRPRYAYLASVNRVEVLPPTGDGLTVERFSMLGSVRFWQADAQRFSAGGLREATDRAVAVVNFATEEGPLLEYLAPYFDVTKPAPRHGRHVRSL